MGQEDSCLSIIIKITAALACLFLLYSLQDPLPKCSIQNFYIPALNKTLNSRHNTSLNFMVRLDNPNKRLGIYYDDLHLTFTTTNTTKASSSALLFVANYTVPKFYQGCWQTTKKWGRVLPLNNQTVLQAVLPNGLAVFRLDLETQVRFSSIFWNTKRYRVGVGANIEVNGYGVKASKNAIEMKKSDSSFPSRSSFPICVLMNLLIFFAVR